MKHEEYYKIKENVRIHATGTPTFLHDGMSKAHFLSEALVYSPQQDVAKIRDETTCITMNDSSGRNTSHNAIFSFDWLALTGVTSRAAVSTISPS